MKMADEKKMAQEFLEFTRLPPQEAPRFETLGFRQTFQRDLNPAWMGVFSKLVAAQSVAGFFSLLLCDQFGMNPFGTSFSLSQYFMTFGHSVCMFLCGGLFVGLGVAASRGFLNLDERRTVGRQPSLQALLLSTLSLGVFLAFGAQMAVTIGILWVVGGWLTGTLAGKWVSATSTLSNSR